MKEIILKVFSLMIREKMMGRSRVKASSLNYLRPVASQGRSWSQRFKQPERQSRSQLTLQHKKDVLLLDMLLILLA